MSTDTPQDRHTGGRRNFLRLSAVGGAIPMMLGPVSQDAAAARPAPSQAAQLHSVRLAINGQSQEITVDGRATLLDVLRDGLHLMGTKKGCDHGQCGACTVHVDGKRVLACLTLVLSAVDHQIRTIEGVAAPGTLHLMQQAFIDNDALQCGYCTPGQIMSAICLVRSRQDASDSEIREYMSGNLCRCAAYPNIVAAIRDVLDRGEAN